MILQKEIGVLAGFRCDGWEISALVSKRLIDRHWRSASLFLDAFGKDMNACIAFADGVLF